MLLRALITFAYLGVATSGWAHGWRDQHIRISPTLREKVTEQSRRLGELGQSLPETARAAARKAGIHADRVWHTKRVAQKRGDKEAVGEKPAFGVKQPDQRRKAMEVVYGAGREITVNGVSHPDMSLFDCPWAASLHPYLDTTAAFAVDGGLCLPYQEIPFPFSIGTSPVNTTTAKIVCPGPNWDPNTATCSTGPGTCKYPGDDAATGMAENYGCAAGNPAWPSSSTAEMQTPICKTFVDDCTYSRKPTRKYQYDATATGPDGAKPNQGYDINWVLSKVGPLRNSLGAGPVMDADLTAAGISSSGFQFPSLYDFFYNVPAATEPPTTGYYPHAFVKGYFGADGFVDDSKDGTCDKNDAATQWMDCGIPCPVGDEARMSAEDLGGFSAAVLAFMFACALIGAASFYYVGRSSEKFFVGGRTLNIFVVTATLASQSLDSNAALGNIDLGYKYHWWDGACLPIGLGLSLVLNGIFFARHLNKMNLLTLPDLFAQKFGSATEVLFAILAIVSFLFLLGGNLVGSGRIIGFLFGIDTIPGIWITAFAIWLYTVSGGLISVAYTDCAQAAVGWLGMIVGSAWVLNNMPTAAGNSPAYPNGDVDINPTQMTDPDALDPIPNAIAFNWITIFVLGFGNLAALDFQARVFSAKSPMTATIGCIVGGILSWAIGITFSFCSGAVRALYGPSSPYAEYVADSCSQDITIIGCFGGGGSCEATVLPGVPTCGEWKPDPFAALRMFTCTKENCHYAFDFDGTYGGMGGQPLTEGYFPMNPFIGGWILVAIIAASMSTGDGAILAMSTVSSHNLLRKLPVAYFKEEANLLKLARMGTLVWTPIAAAIASASPDTSGYLLIVAFDIMLAGSVIPMFAAVYWKGCKPAAAFLAMLGGSLVRLILEFALEKDYLLLLVGKYARSFGPGAYGGIDVATGLPLDGWCPQEQLKDFTGIDSIASPVASLVLLLFFQLVLPKINHPYFIPAPSTEILETKVTASPNATPSGSAHSGAAFSASSSSSSTSAA